MNLLRIQNASEPFRQEDSLPIKVREDDHASFPVQFLNESNSVLSAALQAKYGPFDAEFSERIAISVSLDNNDVSLF
jgi:hypothetical protein